MGLHDNEAFSPDQVAAAKATLDREMPQIERAARKMVKAMGGLENISQKQALLLVVGSWVNLQFDDMGEAERFTAQLKLELDAYVADLKAQLRARNN